MHYPQTMKLSSSLSVDIEHNQYQDLLKDVEFPNTSANIPQPDQEDIGGSGTYSMYGVAI